MKMKKETEESAKKISDKVVAFRLTSEEFSEVKERAAEAKSKTISDFVRENILNGEVKVASFWRADPEEIKRMEELIFQIRKIGVNVNQIAHRTNLEGEVESKSLLLIQELLQKMSRECKNLHTTLKEDVRKRREL